jgi:hypothetical protein
MNTISIIGLIALGVLIPTIVVIVLTKVILHLMRGQLEDRIALQYQPIEILMEDLKANSFGVESAGVWQLRGNGGLVLTGKNLHFFMFLPKSEICIPLETITELAITKSHLGKATPFDLLKVSYSVKGKKDSIAWYLTDPAAWKRKIESLKAGQFAIQGRNSS